MKARRICAWCGREMGEAETYDGSPTHGICPACEEKLWQSQGKAEKGAKADPPSLDTQ